jgi:membrane-bound lytic murein transglycosylase MltF
LLNQKQIFNFLIKVGAVMVLSILHTCSSKTEAPTQYTREDSLLQMVKEQIAEKKMLDIFRERVLPRDFQNKIESYYPVIRKYAKRYGFDWRLIVAQILKESKFKENARSHKGAIGLMQIMPGTAREIHQEMDIEYIANNPRENITAGIFHLYKQLKYFPDAYSEEKIKLALAAYNSGAGRILDAQEIARFLKLDPNLWISVKMSLPKLSRDYWQLHLEVWDMGVPPRGHFNNSNQTIEYVDDIYTNYEYLTKMY